MEIKTGLANITLTFWKFSACVQRLTPCICCAGSSSSFIEETEESSCLDVPCLK
jgi:hypothetical protein